MCERVRASLYTECASECDARASAPAIAPHVMILRPDGNTSRDTSPTALKRERCMPGEATMGISCSARPLWAFQMCRPSAVRATTCEESGMTRAAHTVELCRHLHGAWGLFSGGQPLRAPLALTTRAVAN